MSRQWGPPQHPLLEDPTRREIENRLSDWSEKLALAQRDDGGWEWEWPLAIDPQATVHNSRFRDEIAKCVYSTGHHLEWMAIAPEKYRPPSQNLRKAARYLVGVWRQVVARAHNDWHYYSQASHAARALWLISGRHDLPAFAARRMNPIAQTRKDRP